MGTERSCFSCLYAGGWGRERAGIFFHFLLLKKGGKGNQLLCSDGWSVLGWHGNVLMNFLLSTNPIGDGMRQLRPGDKEMEKVAVDFLFVENFVSG